MSAAVAAANWWADAIGSPRFDNGDRDGTAAVLATILAARQPVGASDARGFAAALTARLESEIERMGEYGVTVAVDYGPDPILANSAREAGVSVRNFPWKTCMWVHADHVTVSAGYQAQTVLVWASDEWLANRPLCHSQHYDEAKYGTVEGYHGEPWRCSLPKYHEGAHAYDEPLALCSVCGAPEDFWHRDERNYRADFHAFTTEVSA